MSPPTPSTNGNRPPVPAPSRRWVAHDGRRIDLVRGALRELRAVERRLTHFPTAR